eukprot:bmy_06294T0
MSPGISQLTEKDLKFWLQTSRAKSIITSDSLAPRVKLHGRGEDTWKSLFFSSSYRIEPVEVESALAEYPAVLESAVVVKAFIVLSPAYSSHDPEKLTQELQEHVKRVTAPYKYPRKGTDISREDSVPWLIMGNLAPERLNQIIGFEHALAAETPGALHPMGDSDIQSHCPHSYQATGIAAMGPPGNSCQI